MFVVQPINKYSALIGQSVSVLSGVAAGVIASLECF